MKIDLEILIDYFTGSLSIDEAAQVELWAAQSSENRKYFDEIKNIWDTPQSNFPKPNIEEALNKVLSRIGNVERKASVYKIDSRQNDYPAFSIIFNSKIVRAAAGIILIFGAVYLAINIFSKNEISLTEIKNYEIQKIELGDGTIVTLDAGSNFKYPKELKNAKMREVFLSGEAFFEVSKNDKSPFIVHANNGLITVLGTKFNIRAWDKSGNVVVAVAEGKVSFQNNSGANKENVVLTKGRMSRLSEDGIITPPTEVDISQYLSWLNREIYFTDTPLADIIHQIERWYNVKIELTDSELLINRITVFIENKPLAENLKLICAMLNLKYEISGNIVKLFSVE